MKIAEQFSEEQLRAVTQAVASAAGLVKVVVGTANNAAWMACLDAFDNVRRHPAYRHQVKHAYRKCFDALHAYERELIYTDTNRFFHVDDLEPEARKLFAEKLTDREYYDFWVAFGIEAYSDTKPFYTSLVNKCRLAYVAHGYQHPDILAWSIAAGLCLDIAANVVYQAALRRCRENEEWAHLHIPDKVWDDVFHAFDLSHVARLWADAHRLLSGHDDMVPLSDIEQRNIEMGFTQLTEKWMGESSLFGSRVKAAKEYVEMFRSKKTMLQRTDVYVTAEDEMRRAKLINI